MIAFDKDIETRHDVTVSIKVIGIGGAGGNMVNSMIASGLDYIDFIVANTDSQALYRSSALKKIQLGKKATKGLGSGANPDLGRRATEEDLDKIMETIGDADIVFIAAGMGGGTGSGGASIVAKALKERGILSVAVVTKPFGFEGRRRMTVAEESLEMLKKEVDTLIVVPNQKLLDVVDRSVSMIESFSMIDELLIHSVKSISDIITQPGHINVDFADLRATMKGMGLAMMGAGCAQGLDRARVAAQQAISSHLIENMDIKKARGILLNITGGVSLTLHEINDAASVIYDESNESAHIIIGSVIDVNMGDKVIVSVIATGFESPVQAYAKKADMQEPIATPVTHSIDQEVMQQAVQQVAKPVVDALPVNEFLQRADAVLDLVQEENSYGKKINSMQQQVHRQVDHDANSLDIPAFLRKPKIDDSYLEPME
ncbi:cell division protein FtsZ [Candidatus Babeliales bacterium]|nr:cell division protein FtsZ [Candidatus Babeliales bacterium]MBP9844138.1 cell division protein FtsZ [Candidatus Babeliales bacterium]